jgi:hypothetical protein
MNPKKMLDDMRTIKQLLTDAERIAREMGEEEPGNGAEGARPPGCRSAAAGRRSTRRARGSMMRPAAVR